LNYTELNKLHGVMRSKKRKEKEHFEQKNGNNKSCLSLFCTFKKYIWKYWIILN